MSYFSIGQEVPDDLLVASKEYLLERFIGDLDEEWDTGASFDQNDAKTYTHFSVWTGIAFC